MTEQKVAVVTGSSSGIGFETALLLARNGFHTYATMRNLEKAKAISDVAKRETLTLHTILYLSLQRTKTEASYVISHLRFELLFRSYSLRHLAYFYE